MEITTEQIQEAIKTNPSLIDGLITPIFESEKGKAALKVETQKEVDAAVFNLHNKYDDQLFKHLGVRAATGPDGKKEKTYEILDTHLANLSRLSKIEKDLNETDVVKNLTAENERLKLSGGGDHWKGVHETAIKKWETEKLELEGKVTEAQTKAKNGVVAVEIAKAKAALKLNPDLPKELADMALENVEKELLANSRIEENGDVTFLDAEGKPRLNTSRLPMSAAEALAEMPAIKTIILKEAQPGGGADPNVKTATIVKVEGKDNEQKLVLPTGSFTTQSSFIQLAEKALLDNGVTRNDPRWDTMKNAAWVENEVEKLPAE